MLHTAIHWNMMNKFGEKAFNFGRATFYIAPPCNEACIYTLFVLIRDEFFVPFHLCILITSREKEMPTSPDVIEKIEQ